MKRYLLLVLPLLLTFASSTQAVIYKWIDHQGEAHFADALEKIPEIYRDQAIDFNQVDTQGSVTYDPNFGKKKPYYKRFLQQLDDLQEKSIEVTAKPPKVILYMTDW
jgi:hypothetical protein